MTHRYALRFENGERRGETVALAGPGAKVGRRPGNTIQILDASVSGRHAEFVVDDQGVLLRDLGSTNGTRVGAARISEQRLAHGDDVLLGNVRMLFIDLQVEASPPMTEVREVDTGGLAGSPEAAGEGVKTISAEKVARSKTRSLTTLLVIVLLLGGGGAAAWFFLGGGGGSTGPVAAIRPVEPVEGDLLAASASFENGAEGWEAVEGAPVALALDSSARRSGEDGLVAELAAGEWAMHRSARVRAGAGRTLKVRGWVRVESAEAALGVRFEGPGVAPLFAWTAPKGPTDGYEELELDVAVPPGYDGARAVLLALANADGVVEFDDVSLAPGAGGGPSIRVDEYQLALVGEPSTNSVIFKIDRVLASDLSARKARGDAPEQLLPITATTREDGMELRFQGADQLTFRVEPQGLASGPVATLGAGGYRTHQVGFERSDVASVLFGSGRDLVRVRVDPPTRVAGRPEGDGFRIELDAEALGSAIVQVSFRAERGEAQNLARDARNAEAAGDLGGALAGWGRVLAEYPFEADLLKEAEATRGRLVQAGLTELDALSERVERARFFRLVDLYRRCRSDARALADRYAGSEVDAGAQELVAKIDEDLVALEADLQQHERARLSSIRETLAASEMPKLADRVQRYLDERFSAEGDR